MKKLLLTLPVLLLAFLLWPEKHYSGPVTIVAFGDSLVAGPGLTEEERFPVQLEKALRAEGYDATVINEGITGDTTGGGLKRIEQAIAHHPHIVILELGANDMLQGRPLQAMRNNLTDIITRLQSHNISILLAGMKSLPHKGPQYMEEFNNIYPRLAKKYDLVLFPYFMEDVSRKAALKLPDNTHPNKDGVAVIVNNIMPYMKKVINNL